MLASNPKKEFTIPKDVDFIKKAILSIPEKEPTKYVLHSDDALLNQIKIHEKGQLFDSGYFIDFGLKKISETETTVTIEISKKLGAIDTPTEVHNANHIIKEIEGKFSAYLSGKEIIKNDGCVVFILIPALYLVYQLFH
ncbi:MAG TPA: hypothetical protein VHM26_10720 [Chitinophagaceae bacterium]|jgi:hypothetical protein|nr:hypothetical protein [Chitinophagaceae bacterium]